MKLTLTVVSYHRFTSDLEAKKAFIFDGSTDSYSIGRSKQCDWYLPDPERVISGQHSLVEIDDKKVTITDLSTNGLFVNRSVKPLGLGNKHILQEGDLLAMGDYEIEISISDLPNISTGDDFELQVDAKGLIGKEEIIKNDFEFGISTSNFVNKEVITTTAENIECIGTEQSLPVFIGNIEDNFVAPDSECNNPDGLEQFSIPEDWSAYLNDEPVGQKELKSNVEESCASSVESEMGINRGEPNEGKSSSNTHYKQAPELEAFIKGLGIKSNMVPSQMDEKWWYELGNAMHHLMSGLMDTLHQRSEFKQNHRLNQTLFKRQENNPLKFSATMEDAVHNLFNRNSTSFLSADKAIQEAFSDIGKHEKSLLTGLDGTVNGMMKLLSPESIKNRVPETQFWHRMGLVSSNSKNWSTYEMLYERLENELEGAGRVFYWDDFVKAYEAQLKELR